MSDNAIVESPRPNGRARILRTEQHERCIRLIEAVKERPILYNSKRVDYRNIEMKMGIWEDVQLIVGMKSTEECQKLWKTLRDRYIRELRAEEARSQGKLGPRKSYLSPWPYYEHLSFYKDCGRAPRTYTRSTRKPRQSVVSASSGEESRENSVLAVAQSPAPTSTSNSPILNNGDSSSNLCLPRDSRSNSAPAGTPDLSATDCERSSSAIREPASSTPFADSKTGTFSEAAPVSPEEHRAFVEVVLRTVSERDREEASQALADEQAPKVLAGRTPLQERSPNCSVDPVKDQGTIASLPTRPHCCGPSPGNVQYRNDENEFIQEQTQDATVLPCKEEALDLSKDVPESKYARQILQAPKKRYASSASSVTVPAPATGLVPLSPAASPKPCLSEILQAGSSSRKRRHEGKFFEESVISESQLKRARLEDQDEDELFALSIIPTLRRLNAAEKSVLKVKIMQNLSEAELSRLTRSD